MIKQTKNRKTKILLGLLALLILGIVATLFVVATHKKNSTASSDKPLPTAQSDFHGSEVKQQPAKTPDSTASATDNSNATSTATTPPSSEWTRSKDGSS